ncbi:putative ABC transporter permease subunit [Haloimpatiens sp. FM7315]|uniref:putative ABC transporter permease subunit n=1 Tax=Haloimpatiens sp. FM7315 TaxID=3298609 RepID=UPI0035A28266
MNKLILLTKLFLKTGENSISQNSKSKLKLKKSLMYVFMFLCFLPIAFIIFEITSNFYDVFAMINQQSAVLSLGFSISCLLIFLFGIFYSINTLYFSKDLDFILPLPFKPWHIVGGKFVTMLIYEYLTGLMFIMPLIIAYGYKSAGGVLYYLYSLIIFLLIPIIPLILSSILVMLIMSFTSIAKDKDRFRKIGGIISIVFIVVLNGFMQKYSKASMDPEKANEILNAGKNGFASIISKIFPTAKFAALGSANSGSLEGFINLIIFIAISVLILCLFIALAEGLYFKGAIGISETSSKRKKLSKEELNKNIVKQSTLIACIKKELRLLFRTPVYFYNCVIMNFLWPVFFIIPMVVGNEGGLSQFEMFSGYLNNPNHYPVVLAGAFSMMIFVAGSNAVTSTAISREGGNIFICKYLPIPYKTQIMAKVLSGVFLGVISEAVLILVAVLLMHLNPYMGMVIFAISLLAILYVCMLGIIIDLYRPKLSWVNEQQAVKQNLNAFIEMLISWATIAVIIIPVIYFKFNLMITTLFIVVLFAIVNLFLYKLIATKGEEKFSKLLD